MITSNHPEWPEFRRRVLDEPIEELRGELENANLTAEQTAVIRGSIAAYRRIIATIERTGPQSVNPDYT